MDRTRVAIIIGMGLVTYLIRVVPQLLLVGRTFPDAGERYLRYLAYAMIASVVATSLFLAGARFEAASAPPRAFALIVAVLLTAWTKNTLLGMITGTLVAIALTWHMGR
jgi:branched-subunit amino acid transport protein